MKHNASVPEEENKMATKTATQKYTVNCTDCSYGFIVESIDDAVKIAKVHASARVYMDGYHASSITPVVGA
jgi:hypothetical protein